MDLSMKTASQSDRTARTKADDRPRVETFDLRPVLVGAAWVTLCWSPLLVRQLGMLLERSHYQFVILLPLAAALLARSRWKELPAAKVKPGRSRTALTFAIGVLALIMTATWLRSPWLGFVGYLFSLLAIVYAVGGRELLKAFLPAWLLLCLCIPLPFGLDERLVTDLREIVTGWTSHVLYLVGVLHLVEGNVIEIPGKAFFVADACTGIHSLFVVLAAAVFIGFLFERSLPRVAVLAACAIGLVLIENVCRLTGVVLAYRWGVDISAGWAHDAFGVLLFAVTLLLVLSADQLTTFLLPDRLTFWRRKRSKSVSDKRSRRDRSSSKTILASRTMLDSRTVLGVSGSLVAALGVLQLWQFPIPLSWGGQEGPKTTLELPELSEDFLPATIEGYQRASYRLDTHPINVHYLSDYSQIWEYLGTDSRLKLSLDYPYPGVHDLCLCYELTGWTIQEKQFHFPPSPDASAARSPAPLVFAELHKPVDGTAYIFFSYFNTVGEEGARLYPLHEPSPQERIRSRINSFLGSQPQQGQADQGPTELNADLSGPVFQVQLLIQSPAKLTSEELARAERFFVAARHELRTRYLARQAVPAGD